MPRSPLHLRAGRHVLPLEQPAHECRRRRPARFRGAAGRASGRGSGRAGGGRRTGRRTSNLELRYFELRRELPAQHRASRFEPQQRFIDIVRVESEARGQIGRGYRPDVLHPALHHSRDGLGPSQHGPRRRPAVVLQFGKTTPGVVERSTARSCETCPRARPRPTTRDPRQWRARHGDSQASASSIGSHGAAVCVRAARQASAGRRAVRRRRARRARPASRLRRSHPHPARRPRTAPTRAAPGASAPRAPAAPRAAHRRGRRTGLAFRISCENGDGIARIDGDAVDAAVGNAVEHALEARRDPSPRSARPSSLRG